MGKQSLVRNKRAYTNGYRQTTTGMIAKTGLARSTVAKLRRALHNQPIASQAVFGKFSAKPHNEIKTIDNRFSGVYNVGLYTVDSEPFQCMPINGTTQVVQAINMPQQGAGISNRIGNKISLKSVRIRLALVSTSQNPLSGRFPPSVRILLIYDRNTNGGYPALNAILGYSRQDNTVQAGTYLDNLNPNGFDRYVVLMDKHMPLPVAEDTTVTTPDSYKIDEFIKLKNLETQFSTTTSPMVVANIAIGGLYLCVWGDPSQTINDLDVWQFAGSSRLRFRDT